MPQRATHNLSLIQLFCYVVVGIITILLVAAYCRPDQLDIYDTAGHVLAVHNLAATWPSLFTWHSNTLLGLIYGNLYPPLPHWVMAGIATVIGVNSAVMLVTSVAIIAVPLVLWLYASAIHSQPLRRVVVVMVGIAILLLMPGYLGMGYSGLFQFGLLTSFLATPLVVAAWALTERIAKGGGMRAALLLGILGGVLCWSHIVATIAAAVYVIAALGRAIVARQRSTSIAYGTALGVALTVAAPFVVIFLQSYKPAIGQLSSIASSSVYSVSIVGLSGICWFAVKHFRITKGTVPISLIAGSLLGIVCVADTVLFRVLSDHSFLYSLSAYRLQPYALLLLGLAVTQLVVGYIRVPPQLMPHTKHVRTYGLAAVGACLLIIAGIRSPFRLTHVAVTQLNTSTIDSRFLEQFSRSDSQPLPYALQTKLAMQNSSTQWAYGVFIESEPNAPFIKSLSMSLRAKAKNESPGVPVHLPEDVLVDSERHQALLRHFGISTVLGLDTNPREAIGVWQQDTQKKYYHAVTQPQVLAEVPSLPLRPVSDQWEKNVLAWWQSSGPMTDIPYNAVNGKISGSTIPVPIEVREWGPDSIILHVSSSTPTIILVKASFHQQWSGVDSAEHKLQIYQAAPNLLLVSGSGTLTLTMRR